MLFDKGKLEKMKITAYEEQEDPEKPLKLSKAEEDTYSVMVNPASYNMTMRILRDTRQGQGTSGTDPRFLGIAPTDFEFEFLFDATGVIPKAPENALGSIPIVGTLAGALTDEEAEGVMEQINSFNRVVYHYEGERHGPRRVYINWGKFCATCQLSSINFNFKLFSPDGTPLRAIGKAAFIESIPECERELGEKNSSPDLTHVRVVKEGDTLPLMTERIYGDASLYMEVARVNNLFNFRNLKVGTKLVFPPLDQSN